MLEFLGDKSKANEEDASLVIAQLVEALCYLHRQNVVHLDIRVSKKVEKLLDVCPYQASEKRREETCKKEKTDLTSVDIRLSTSTYQRLSVSESEKRRI